ncbi:hypothetical protein [Granulicella sp. S156]|jgi:hypothetical protein|uniref:hypothetical protein n=1 Tax=Granulicella sp. S156 TaxID=1747224 RepID=UPI00131A8B08|nr:hypothetical protein [Granulicella sp. S156]
MSELIDFVYQGNDIVKVEGQDGLWTVKGSFGAVGQPPSRYDLMLGRDASKLNMATPDKMTLVERSTRQDEGGPRLIPARGIMDY